METVSEKPRRGRPSVFSREEYDLVSCYSPEVRTRRGRQNRLYMHRAMGALGDGEDDRFHWLHPPREAVMKRGARLRKRILSELGRIDDDDDLREMALVICEQKPTAKKAVAWIRRFRGASKKSAPGLDLTRRLIHCINDYCETHPETTRQQIETVLENVARCLEPDE